MIRSSEFRELDQACDGDAEWLVLRMHENGAEYSDIAAWAKGKGVPVSVSMARSWVRQLMWGS